MMVLAGLAGYVAYGIGRDIAGGAADVIARPTATTVVDANSPSARAVTSQIGSEPVVTPPAVAMAAPGPQSAVSVAAVAASSPIPVATAGSAPPMGGSAAPNTNTTAPPTVPAVASAGEPAPAAPIAAANPPVSAANTTVQTSQAVKLGQPLRLAGVNDTVVLMATNATDKPLGFTARAEIMRGGAVVATATGGLPVVLAGQTRVLSLKSEDPIPANFDAANLRVDSVADPPPGAAAAPIALGTPKLTRGAPAAGEVVATNTSATPHTFTIQAAFARGDRLVGLVSAPVGSLAPGQSHAVALNSPSGAPADVLYTVVDSIGD
jgi:hypothetical protein